MLSFGRDGNKKPRAMQKHGQGFFGVKHYQEEREERSDEQSFLKTCTHPLLRSAQHPLLC